ncbi:HAD family hydrolase [Thermophilibacter immobilis]|jgi:phosphoglycolate phosphatase|uniref:HAD hydrolase-like protein n=1 Tax=Thermophilibacter immobilis TaxID=2779519 RepID=A0A7S7M8X9_9ACTN|nr:HAD hydrolase-like protein [Thermophilibacter immobilis]QOY60038.1 HAD hydrolase-like protein [Thermophilibacter immobilis]
MALTGIDVTSCELVIFDFDGTLANTMDGITRVAREALLDHGLGEGDLGDLRRLVGPPFPQAFSMVYGLSASEAVEVTAAYRRIYATLGIDGWPAFEGVPELLRELRRAGKRCAVASSKRAPLVTQAVADNDLDGLFDLVLGKLSDEESTKAATIAQVLDELGADASDAVMVGDRRFDVEAASACEVPCVGAHYGRTCPLSELVDAGACSIAETVGELGRILLG